MNRRGFTLVEAVIVAVVIVVILAVTVPWMRERERARLQVLAETEPWEVFELRATALKQTFTSNEEIVVQCEILNLTDYALTLPQDLGRAILVFEDEYFVDFQLDKSEAMPELSIAAGESARFDVSFWAFGGGITEVSVAYWRGFTDLSPDITISAIPPLFVERRHIGKFSSDKSRFQSGVFQLTVEPVEDTDDGVTSSFDDWLEIVDDTARRLDELNTGGRRPDR